MNKYNLPTLKLKLQRHKIAFQVSKEGHELIFGGVRNIPIFITLFVIIPTLAGLALLSTGIFYDLGFLEIIGIFSFLGGLSGIQIIRNKKKNNKELKIIKDGELEIQPNGTGIKLSDADIKDLDISVKLVTQGQYEGKLDVYYGTETVTLICIYDENYKLLTEDLNYIKAYIEQKLLASIA